MPENSVEAAQPIDTSRRLAEVLITREALQKALGLPKSVRIHKAEWHIAENAVLFVVEHKDLEEVEENNPSLPRVELVTESPRPRFTRWM